MKRKLQTSIFCGFLTICLFCMNVYASTPKEDVIYITNNMNTLLQITRNNGDGVSSFKNECNRFVKAQLDFLGVMPYSASPHRGGRNWCKDAKVSDGTTTTTGYKIKQIIGSNCLDQLLSQSSQPIYDVVISFDGFSSDAWGHVCYIHAIADNKVYFTDNWTYRGSNLVAFQPVELDIATFRNYETTSNGPMNALVHFYKEGTTFKEGWDDSQGYWRYGLSNGTYATNRFVDLGRDKKYYFGAGGAMITNELVFHDGKIYHAAADGHMDLGWHNIDGAWYYFNDPSGEALTSTWKDYNGTWYYLSDSGPRICGITKKVDGKIYRFAEDGAATEVQPGWCTVQGKYKYLLDTGGYVVNDFVDLGRDKKYFLDEKANLVTSDWVNHGNKWYYAAEDGHMNLGWQKINGKWYYFNDPSGEMKTNGWEEYDGKRYYLSGDGWRYSNTTQVIDGKTYEFDQEGVAREVSQNSSEKRSDSNNAKNNLKPIWQNVRPEDTKKSTSNSDKNLLKPVYVTDSPD